MDKVCSQFALLPTLNLPCPSSLVKGLADNKMVPMHKPPTFSYKVCHLIDINHAALLIMIAG